MRIRLIAIAPTSCWSRPRVPMTTRPGLPLPAEGPALGVARLEALFGYVAQEPVVLGGDDMLVDADDPQFPALHGTGVPVHAVQEDVPEVAALDQGADITESLHLPHRGIDAAL